MPAQRHAFGIAVALLVSGLMIAAPARAADSNDASAATAAAFPDERNAQGQVPDALKPPEPPKKEKKVKKVMHALGKELGTSFSDLGKDMVIFLSVQDIDPYEKGPPTDKPYELTEIRWLDGSGASVTRYPDGSCKVVGGFSDGTVIVPKGGNMFDILYPNGAKGKVEKLPGGSFRVYRPDNTVTSITKTMSGDFSISNDKLGYMGTATPDHTGLRYEMQ